MLLRWVILLGCFPLCCRWRIRRTGIGLQLPGRGDIYIALRAVSLVVALVSVNAAASRVRRNIASPPVATVFAARHQVLNATVPPLVICFEIIFSTFWLMLPLLGRR